MIGQQVGNKDNRLCLSCKGVGLGTRLYWCLHLLLCFALGAARPSGNRPGEMECIHKHIVC